MTEPTLDREIYEALQRLVDAARGDFDRAKPEAEAARAAIDSRQADEASMRLADASASLKRCREALAATAETTRLIDTVLDRAGDNADFKRAALQELAQQRMVCFPQLLDDLSARRQWWAERSLRDGRGPCSSSRPRSHWTTSSSGA